MKDEKNKNDDKSISLLDLQSLLSAVKGTVVSSPSNNAEFSFVSAATDSRNVTDGCMFVPLVGEFQDGHAYIPQAVSNGASVILVNRSYADEHADILQRISAENGVWIIAVDHTMRALQHSAAAYVSLFKNLTKIGITGSSGKTTTKEIAANILGEKYTIISNEGNLNSETGLPLSVFKIRAHHQVGIFEMGMNRRGEIKELADVLFPDFALITNIGTAHIGILGTKHAIAEEKKQIFSNFNNMCTGFIPESDEYASFLAEGLSGKICKYGAESTAGLSRIQDCGLNGTSFVLDGVEMTLPLCGRYNFLNALGAVSIAREMGMSAVEIKRGIESIKPLFGRSQVFTGDITVIKDCYNANPDSMESALYFCGSLQWTGKKIFILGDMLELGERSSAEHNHVGRLLLSIMPDIVVFFGPAMQEAADVYGRSISVRNEEHIFGQKAVQYFSFPNTDDESAERINKKLDALIAKGDLVFIKGSRGMKMERFADYFTVKTSRDHKSGGRRE